MKNFPNRLSLIGKNVDRRDVIEAASKGDERAILAIKMESYRLKKYIGAYTTTLGRVDALIFTAGAGEMSDIIRGKVLEGLDVLRIKYNPKKNRLARTRNTEFDISSDDSLIKIFIIPTAPTKN